MKTSKAVTGNISHEEFFSLPRIEFIIDRLDKAELANFDKMVINEKLEISDRFSMEIPDNRMADAGICKGDYAIVQRKHKYSDGDIIVANLGERVFIRRYFRSKNRIRLECNTPDRQSMILDQNTPGFFILGVVIQVIRKF